MSANLNEFLTTLESVFLKTINYQEILENCEFLDSLKLLPECDLKSQILQNMKQIENCIYDECSNRGCKIDCGHRICQSHLLNLSCQTCRNYQCPDHLNRICPKCPSSEVFLSNKDKPIQLYCQSCYQSYNAIQFIQTTCMHECINCINPSLSRKAACKICSFSYDNVKSMRTSCERCEKVLAYKDTFILGCNHQCCLACMTLSYQTRQCILCGENLSEGYLIKMLVFQKCRCQNCSTRVKTIDSFYCERCDKDYCKKCATDHSH